MKKVVVISLGGSLIIPDDINLNFLKKFKSIIKRNLKKYKFVIVCGGGGIAREYISELKEEGINEKLLDRAGLFATKMNAIFMNYFFDIDTDNKLPLNKKEVGNILKKKDLIFCGGWDVVFSGKPRYMPNQTTDATATELAAYFKSELINLTNVKGLYDKNPKKFKSAKFISQISWNEFNNITKKLKGDPGQHFVLDKTASKIILKNKVPTYILNGNNIKQLDNVLRKKEFVGTLIKGKI